MTDASEDLTEKGPGRSRAARIALYAVLAMAVALAGIAIANRQDAGDDSSAGETTGPTGTRMAGLAVDVNVTDEALASEPAAPDLSSPESAVMSYLDWSSFAYRIGQSQVARDTMGPNQEVHVDSYVQYNIQQGRLLDQRLQSIGFGESIAEGEMVYLPATEKWTYRYISITEAGEVLGGPYEASYETTYTVVRTGDNTWVVDDIQARALGEVK